jgi:outer membrane murein-binding lipoprotein Lpp
MSKQVRVVFMIIVAVTASALLFGCTTAQSRRQNQRIEELERRVAKIEFDSNDSPSTDDEFAKYRNMARTTR